METTPVLVEPSPATGYQKAETLADVRSLGASLPRIAQGMLASDVAAVLGRTPEDLKEIYGLEGDLAPVHEFATVLLSDLAGKVLAHTEGGEFQKLNPERMSLDRVGDAVAQHVGYVAGVMSRTDKLKEHPDTEMARILLRGYFEGTLAAEGDTREFLAGELAKAAGGGPEVANFVMAAENDGLFTLEGPKRGASLLSNLAAHYAGEKTLEFASKMMGGNERRAEAFVKSVFGRPEGELAQLLRDPHGQEGLLVNFAGAAHHLAWEWAKLGSAVVEANDNNPKALAMWNHPKIAPTRQVAGDAESALKNADQIESYLLREGKLVPCDRSGGLSDLPMARLLANVERQGIYADEGPGLRGSGASGLRIVSPFAMEVRERLWDDTAKAARLSDWRSAAEVVANTVSHTCASFAAQAIDADFEERDRLVTLYRDALSRFEPQLDKLFEDGKPTKQDERYQALYQELAGEFGFEALKEHMGVGKAHELVRDARFGDLIPVACEALRLPVKEDYTAANLVSDLAFLKKNLLKDDYFLSQEGYLQGLAEEAAQPAPGVDPRELQNAVRIPNAVWMWTQLLRGLVEGKPQRYTGSGADLNSDTFPSAVQFNPPDVRDVELFTWARHRLGEAGVEPRQATRSALALIVLTLHKDLEQLRKAA